MNKKLKPYKQKIKSCDNAFSYEYWWVTNNEIYGYRLMRVRIPPAKGACSDWNYEFMTLEDLSNTECMGKIYPFEEMKEWSWEKHIQQPK